MPADPPEGKESSGLEQAGGFWHDRGWRVRLAHTTLASWISAGLTMLSVVVAARSLGPENYGVVVLALSVTTVAARLLDFTFGEAVVHHGHRALAVGDIGGLRSLMRLSLLLDLVIGVVLAGILLLLAVPLAELASADGIDPSLVRIAALGVLVVTVDGTTGAVLLIAGRPDLRAWTQAGASLFRATGTVGAVALGGGPEAILLSYVLSGALSSALLGGVAWRIAWRRWTRARRGALPISVSRLVRFAFHSSATTSVDAAGESLFPLILGNLAGPGAVGVFRASMLPVLASNMLSQPLRLVLFPEQARLHAEGNLAELRKATKGYTLLALTVALPAAVIGWFAMPALINLLFSSSFDGAVTAARILLVAGAVQFALSWSKSFHAAVGRPHIRTILATINIALSLTLLLLLGDRGGRRRSDRIYGRDRDDRRDMADHRQPVFCQRRSPSGRDPVGGGAGPQRGGSASRRARASHPERQVRAPAATRSEMSPVFVFGADHSGTTILYRMLAYHPALTWLSQFSLRRGEIPGRGRRPMADRLDPVLRSVRHPWRKETTRLRHWLVPQPGEEATIWAYLLRGRGSQPRPPSLAPSHVQRDARRQAASRQAPGLLPASRFPEGRLSRPRALSTSSAMVAPWPSACERRSSRWPSAQGVQPIPATPSRRRHDSGPKCSSEPRSSPRPS